MKNKFNALLKTALCAGTIAVAATGARAQITLSIAFPTPEFIATTPPVFFEGHAAYWFGGRWYFRDGRAWRYYREEPSFLRERRMHHEPERHFYGRDHDGGFDRRR